MNELLSTKDLQTLAMEINQADKLAQEHKESAISYAVKCGGALASAKSLVEHGKWLDWLKSNCALSERTAQNYMKLAHEYPLVENSNTQRVADLSIREALKLLSQPKETKTVDLSPDWLPKGETLAYVLWDGLESVYIQEAWCKGFYYIFCITGHVDYTIKPTRFDHVERVIFDWLPGHRTRNCEVKNFDWKFTNSPDFIRNTLIDDSLIPDSYKHLRKKAA